MAYTHDVIVIGAGAAGLTAAGGCARAGLRAALIERDRMGGECLNTGCVPSKALLAAARRAQAMRGEAMGIRGGEPAIDFAAVRAHVRAAIDAIAPHDSEARFAAWGVEVVRGTARFTGRATLDVDGRAMSAPRIVVATGSRPSVPPIPGLAAIPFLTNETLFDLAELPSHLIVLGGGPVGIEMAQAFRRLGAAVTVIDAAGMLGGSDREAADLVLARLRVEGVALLPHTHATEVRTQGAGVRVGHGAGGTDGSHLLVAAGRTPDLSTLDLAAAGIEAGADGIVVDARRQTSNPRVLAIGDCRAGPRLTHAAGRDGTIAVANIAFGLRSGADDDALPSVAYTDPELAQLGLTEAAARERHGRVQVIRQDMSDSDRAAADGDTAGFIKVVRAGRRIVGVTIVGAGAGELLLPWSQAMAGRASLWSMSGSVVAYPTRSELSKAAAFAAYETRLFGPAARRWARTLATLRRIVVTDPLWRQ